MILDQVFELFFFLIKMIVLLAGLACLHLAALNRKYQLLKLLVKKGADLNVQVSLSLFIYYGWKTKLQKLHYLQLILV